jgi:uncharacterized membrane protein YqjE
MDPLPKAQASAGSPSGVRELVSTFVLYIEARLRLVQIESKEAGARLLSLTLLAVITLGALCLGWLIAVPALIWLISEKLSQPWHLVALVTAAIHLAFGFICLVTLKIKLARLRLFEDTVSELQKDRQWLAPKHP